MYFDSLNNYYDYTICMYYTIKKSFPSKSLLAGRFNQSKSRGYGNSRYYNRY